MFSRPKGFEVRTRWDWRMWFFGFQIGRWWGEWSVSVGPLAITRIEAWDDRWSCIQTEAEKLAANPYLQDTFKGEQRDGNQE